MNAPAIQAVTGQTLSARQIAHTLMQDDTLPDAEQSFVSRLLAQLPDLADFVTVSKRLNNLLRKKSKEALDKVLKDAGGTALKEVCRQSPARPQRRAGHSKSSLDHQSGGGSNKLAQDVETDDVWSRQFWSAPRSRSVRLLTQR